MDVSIIALERFDEGFGVRRWALHGVKHGTELRAAAMSSARGEGTDVDSHSTACGLGLRAQRSESDPKQRRRRHSGIHSRRSTFR
jgi:hypothetical protein